MPIQSLRPYRCCHSYLFLLLIPLSSSIFTLLEFWLNKIATFPYICHITLFTYENQVSENTHTTPYNAFIQQYAPTYISGILLQVLDT